MVGRQTTIQPREWIGSKEAAALMGCSLRWLYDNYRTPGWPGHFRIGYHLRFPRREFEEFVEAQIKRPGGRQ